MTCPMDTVVVMEVVQPRSPADPAVQALGAVVVAPPRREHPADPVLAVVVDLPRQEHPVDPVLAAVVGLPPQEHPADPVLAAVVDLPPQEHPADPVLATMVDLPHQGHLADLAQVEKAFRYSEKGFRQQQKALVNLTAGTRLSNARSTEIP